MQNPSIRELVDLARNAEPRLGTTRLMLIDGRAGAGKSTLANRLAVSLGGTASSGAGTFNPDAPLAASAPVQILHADDMYEGWAGPATMVDILLDRVLVPLASGRDGGFEMWDWAADARSHTIAVAARPWLIVEGVGVGLPQARELAVLTVFVDAPWEVRLQRGIERDHLAYADVVERWTGFEAQEREMHERNGTREAADFVLDGTAAIPDR